MLTNKTEEKQKLKESKGITLIALVITIIVLLILAGVAIATLTGENGILTQANKGKIKSNIAELKESIELQRQAMIIENEGKDNKTASEFIDYLVKKEILEEDRLTFKKNSEYQLIPNGYIKSGDDVVEKVNLTSYISSQEDTILNTQRTFNCYDGDIMGIVNVTVSGQPFTALHINAREAPEGYKFAYWINMNGDIVSYDSEFKWKCKDIKTIPISENFCAVYVPKEEPILIEPIIAFTATKGPAVVEKSFGTYFCNVITKTVKPSYVNEITILRTPEDKNRKMLTLENVNNDTIKKRTFSNLNVSDYTLYYYINLGQTAANRTHSFRACLKYIVDGKEYIKYSNTLTYDYIE